MNYACPHCGTSLRWTIVRRGEGGDLVQGARDRVYSCPRCGGKLLSNVVPLSPLMGRLALFGWLGIAIVSPFLPRGPMYWAILCPVFAIGAWAAIREQRRNKGWQRWLPGH